MLCSGHRAREGHPVHIPVSYQWLAYIPAKTCHDIYYAGRENISHSTKNAIMDRQMLAPE